MDILPVSGWQIVQGSDEGLTVLLSGVPDPAVAAALTDRLAAGLRREGVQLPSLTVRWVDRIPQATSGKAPLIKAARF